MKTPASWLLQLLFALALSVVAYGQEKGVGGSPPKAANTATQADYELASRVGTIDAWNSFLAEHPAGFYADLARAQLAKLRAGENPAAKK